MAGYAGMWTKETVLALLNEDSPRGRRAVERALISLYDRQTAVEQVTHDTKEHNGVGFMSCHANTGTWLVRTIIKENTERGYAEGNRLRGKCYAMALRIVRRYAGTQLLQIARAKEAAALAKKQMTQQTLPGVTNG